MTGGPSESRTVDLAIRQKGLSVQEASQRLISVVLGLPGHAGIRRAMRAAAAYGETPAEPSSPSSERQPK